MYIQARIEHNDEATCTTQVSTQYDDPETVFGDTMHNYSVTIDKILGQTTVHYRGETKRTRVTIENFDDINQLQEAAILAAIYFPQKGE